jgi:hypothetical protein
MGIQLNTHEYILGPPLLLSPLHRHLRVPPEIREAPMKAATQLSSPSMGTPQARLLGYSRTSLAAAGPSPAAGGLGSGQPRPDLVARTEGGGCVALCGA